MTESKDLTEDFAACRASLNDSIIILYIVLNVKLIYRKLKLGRPSLHG